MHGRIDGFPRVPPVHAAQHRVVHMLDRHVDILGDVVMAANRVQQFVAHAVRIAIQQTDAADALHRRQLLQQRRKHGLFVQIQAVFARILRDQDHFLDTARRQRLDLFHDFGHWAAFQVAADIGNRAIGTAVIASLGNLDICIIPRRREQAVCIVARDLCRVVLLRPFAAQRLFHSCDNLVLRGHAQKGVHFREVFRQFPAVSPGQTATHDERLELARFLILRHFQNRVDGFLLGAFDKPAGIHKDHIRFLRLRRKGIPRFPQLAEHQFRVYPVFRASEGNDAHFSFVHSFSSFPNIRR